MHHVMEEPGEQGHQDKEFEFYPQEMGAFVGSSGRE